MFSLSASDFIAASQSTSNHTNVRRAKACLEYAILVRAGCMEHRICSRARAAETHLPGAVRARQRPPQSRATFTSHNHHFPVLNASSSHQSFSRFYDSVARHDFWNAIAPRMEICVSATGPLSTKPQTLILLQPHWLPQPFLFHNSSQELAHPLSHEQALNVHHPANRDDYGNKFPTHKQTRSRNGQIDLTFKLGGNKRGNKIVSW